MADEVPSPAGSPHLASKASTLGSSPVARSMSPESPLLSPRNKDDELRSLDDIFADPELALVYREFLHKCYNSENLAFYVAIESYKNLAATTKEKEWLRHSKAIMDQFFDAESKYEICVESKLKADLERKLAAPNRATFDRVQKNIYGEMQADTFPKFVLSDIYKSYCAGEYSPQMPEEQRKLIRVFKRKRHSKTQSLRHLDEHIKRDIGKRMNALKLEGAAASPPK